MGINPGLHPSQSYRGLNPVKNPYIESPLKAFQALRGASAPLEKGIFGILKMFLARCASPGPATRRDEGHRAEVERRTTGLDRPSHLTPHWARLGPGDGAWHARPTSTEGCMAGLHPYCTRVCTRWPLTGFKPGGVSGTLDGIPPLSLMGPPCGRRKPGRAVT